MTRQAAHVLLVGFTAGWMLMFLLVSVGVCGTAGAAPAHAKGSASPEPSASPLQTMGGERITLAECLEFAKKNHPRLKEKEAAYDRGLALLLQSRAMYSDAFTVTVARSQTYTFNAGQAATLVPPLSNTTINLQPLFTFAYPLLDGGKRRFSIERDRRQLLTYACDLRTEWRQLSLDIQTGYLGVLYERDQLEVQQDSARRAQDVVDEAEGQYRAGRKSRVDVLRARSELTRARASYYRQMGDLNRAWRLLEATVGSPMNPFAQVDDLYREVPTPPLPSPERIIQVAYANRSDLLKAVYQVEVQRKQIQVNESDTRPTLQSRLDYGFLGQDMPLYNHWMTSLSLSIPVSAWGKVRASNAEAQALISGYIEGAKALRLQILGTLGSQYVDYNSAAVQVDLYAQAVKQTQEAYDTSMQRYRSGLADFTEVSQTRQELISARSSLAAAQRDRKLAELKLLSSMERLP